MDMNGMIDTGDNGGPAIEGLTLKQWCDLLCTPKAMAANKALNYLDGNIECEMIKLLSDPHKGRKQWRERGIVPRFRNITKAIVEKSGRLFKDVPPQLTVCANDCETDLPNETDAIYRLLNNTEWIETFANLDIVVRLLKTAMLLVQWSDEEQRLTFDILHRGNCAVMLQPNSRKVSAMIYMTGEMGEDEGMAEHVCTYRIITTEQFIDVQKVDNKYAITGVNPNPYGVVPLVEFYDTQIPRSGYWVDAPNDLIAMNEMVNLHYTDAEYAISWAKLPTLFTNCRFQGDGGDTWETVTDATHALPYQAPVASAVVGGPSRAIQLDSQGIDSPFVKYESPKVDISPMDTVVENWVKAYAADWSVNIHTKGEGKAQSGFQLVVEEIDNLELRKQRQRMFEAGFKRFFQIVKAITPGTFTSDSVLFAEFPTPILPVNTLENEQSWSIKIDAGRATEVDYFIEAKGLSEREAEEKWLDIIEFNKQKQALLGSSKDQVEQVEETLDISPEDVEVNDIPVPGDAMANQMTATPMQAEQ